jgi:putative DNA primase/helicase
MSDIIEQFRDAIRAAGLIPPDLIEPGRFYRFPGEGKAGSNTAAWCKLFPDGKGGIYGDYSTGLSEDWQANHETPYTPEEREVFRRHVAAARVQAEATREALQNDAKAKSTAIWNETTPAPADHPYLVTKGIKASGARFYHDALVIPMTISGEIHSLQFIGSMGEKRFLTGGRKKGCYFSIGTMRGATALAICEGFATGASIHAATGYPVAVAFDAGNLGPVATTMREKFPNLPLILCADDDQRTEGNPGITKATEAARSVGGLLAVPDFGTSCLDNATDFNDMAKLRGLEAVKSAIARWTRPDDQTPQHDVESPPACNFEGLPDAVKRLAGLHSLEYEKVREREADALGVRVSALDKEVVLVRRALQEEGGKAVMFPIVTGWDEPVEANALLKEVHKAIKQFIICESETAIAATLWIAFTWLVDVVEVAPLAVITAPEKRCGKSQLLNLIGRLSRRPLVAANISPAATFRVIEAHCPTLLIDEADSFLKDNEELRGVINSGHTRQSAYVIRTVGDDHEPQQFSTWGAKAISGIGHLSETIMDRAVILELRRKLPTESVQRLRHAERGMFDRLASQLARFAEDAAAEIRNARPELPDALNDRAQDNWEPLLAIADYAGADWPHIARDAALRLSGSEQEAMSPSAELLTDIQEAFETKATDRLSTAALIEALTGDELKPWATFNRGKPMTPRQLAKRVAAYGIHPQTVRFGSDTSKGYLRSWFDDAFSRYLTISPPATDLSVTTSQSSTTQDISMDAAVPDNESCDGTRNLHDTPNLLVSLGCDVVTDGNNVSDDSRVEVEI